MLGDGIERLVVEHAHQLRLGWLAVRCRDIQCPFLLLARCQSVAETLPSDIEFLLWQRSSDGHLVGIAYAILHKTVVDDNSRSKLRLVGERQGDDAVADFPSPLLQQLVASNDGIHDVNAILG